MDGEVKSVIEVDIGDYLKLLTNNLSKIKAREFLLDRNTRSLITSSTTDITPERIIPDYFTDKSILEKILTLKAFMEEN